MTQTASINKASWDGLDISADFTCGAGRNIRKLGEKHYALTIPADPPTIPLGQGYDYYFCIRLENKSGRFHRSTLDALRPDYEGRKVKWRPSPLPIFASKDFKDWGVLGQVQASENYEEYRIKTALPPGAVIYISNSIPCSYREMAAWLWQTQSDNNQLSQLAGLGPSLQGREILLLSISDPKVKDAAKNRILVTSGFHPAEPDWLATTTIIENLLSNSKWAKNIRQRFIIDVVTQVNPDGFDLGTNGCNSSGINLYWDFRSDDLKASPEAFYLWNWIKDHPPCLYLDFHCYVYQLNKDFRPYIRPLSDYREELRPLVCEIDKRLIALCAGRSIQGSITNDPKTLAAQITNAFGTITYTKFHLHLKHGVQACGKLGWKAFKTIVDVVYKEFKTGK